MQVALAATMKSYGVTPGRRHRPLAGRGRGSGRRRSAVAGRRGARDLPPLQADDPHRRFRRDGIGGTACPASAFGTDGSRRRRRRGGGGGLAAVHRDRRRHPDGARSGRGVGAAGRDGPRGRRRRRIALPAGRPDPGRADRCAGRHHPDDTGGSLLLRDPVRPARTSPTAMPITGPTICATRCGSPRRCRPPWRTATGSSPSWPRTRC